MSDPCNEGCVANGSPIQSCQAHGMDCDQMGCNRLGFHKHHETHNLHALLKTQFAWSRETFGPRYSIDSVLDHLKKEVKEIEEDPSDLFEWIDSAMLSFEGASRAGYSPEEIANAFCRKLEINMARQWPDWRTAEDGKAITHIKDPE